MKPTGPGAFIRFASAVCSGILRVYPARFRRRLGDDLRSTFEARVAAAKQRRGVLPAVFVLARGCVIMFGDALWERWRESRAPQPVDRPRVGRLAAATQDLRWAARSLRRAPAFSILIVVVLAVSLGANTAIFSVVDSVLFRPLPLNSPDRLVVACETNEVVEGFCTTSFVNVRDWHDRSLSFAAFGAARGWPFVLALGDANESVGSIMASPEMFDVFQFTPQLGRLFYRSDGGAMVVVLTDGAWRTWFGSDPAVIGTSMSLGGEPYEIIGVLPPEARVPGLESGDIWVPIPFDYSAGDNREWRGFRAFGRMQDGVALRSATEELRAIVADMSVLYPETNVGWGVRSVSLQDYVVGDSRDTLLVFLGAIGFVLLIAGTNVAHLILVRSARRTKEIAVLAAIGAGPVRVKRMLLLESVLLSLGGAAVGLIIASVAVDAFVALAPAGVPRIDEVTLDVGAVVFLGMTSLATAVLVAFAPARLAARLDVAQALKGAGGRPGGPVRFGSGWVIAGQVALTSTLLVGAGLLMRSFLSFTSWDPGFEPNNLTTFWALAGDSRYDSGHEVVAAFHEAAARLEALPVVVSASTVSGGPLFGGRETFRISAEDAQGTEIVARWFDAGTGYFETMRQPLLRGRTFDRSDQVGSPAVVVVNAATANRLWPDTDPIGQRILISEPELSMEVVGVVADITPFTPGTPVEYSIYWPNLQQPRWATHFVVRSLGGGENLAALIEGVMESVDPEMGVSRLTSMEDLVAARLVQPRFNMVLIGSFAVCATLLAAAGVFGMISYSVARRTREMGIRKSLGATSGEIARQVLREGLAPAMAGITIGMIATVALGGILQGVVFGVSPSDPFTMVGTAAVLVLVAAAASLIPALTAARVQPMVALRAE